MNRSAGHAALRQIVHDVQATLALPRYTGAPQFMAQLSHLQAYQSARMRHTHRDWYATPADGLLLDFIVGDVYRGIDLALLKTRLATAERVLGTLFNDFELVQVAVAFTAITSSLDDQLAQLLAPTSNGAIGDLDYAGAVRQQNRMAERVEQGALLLHFTRLLLDLQDDSVAWRAIQWAKLPAHVAGFGGFHSLVSHGYATLRGVENAADKVERLTTVEADYFAAL
ncbi:MAG: hypothetical protein IPN06_03235 [Burkholderiales bacterium]|nr:hypothetical protein [Burkholderiales bacterium]